jgi:hypothetical protein
VSDAAPPPWVKALALDSGSWRALVGAWGWGPFRKAGDPVLDRAVVVTASAATIGRKTGQGRRAVAKQLSKLAAEGWVMRREDGGLVLASWGVPFVFERPEELPDGATWANPAPGPTGPAVVPQDRGPTGPERVPQGRVPQGYPPWSHRTHPYPHRTRTGPTGVPILFS